MKTAITYKGAIYVTSAVPGFKPAAKVKRLLDKIGAAEVVDFDGLWDKLQSKAISTVERGQLGSLEAGYKIGVAAAGKPVVTLTYPGTDVTLLLAGEDEALELLTTVAQQNKVKVPR